MKAVWVFLGGGLGANARYFLGQWISSRWGSVFPWSTTLINITGSLIIGLFMAALLRASWNPDWRLFVAVGILGGYTTFSAFSLDAVLLWERGERLLAATYVGGSVALSILGLVIGLWTMRAALA